MPYIIVVRRVLIWTFCRTNVLLDKLVLYAAIASMCYSSAV